MHSHHEVVEAPGKFTKATILMALKHEMRDRKEEVELHRYEMNKVQQRCDGHMVAHSKACDELDRAMQTIKDLRTALRVLDNFIDMTGEMMT